MEELENKIDDYLEVIDRFINLLTEENKALAEYNVVKVSSLYETKSKTVSAYRTFVAYFIKNKDALKEVDEDILNSLKEKSFELDDLLKQNDILLKTRMQTSKTIMESIVNIAKATTKISATNYGSCGDYGLVEKNRSAIAINQTL